MPHQAVKPVGEMFPLFRLSAIECLIFDSDLTELR
jgi:hypothetical protein